MKMLYNQKENYIEYIKEELTYIFEMLNNMGIPEQAEDAYNKMVAKKTKLLEGILSNGIDTGSLVKNIEQITDIVYDGEGHYCFLITRGKNNYLYDADLTLSRMG